VFEDFLTRFPNSAREPQVRLAIGRTYELQREWPGAVQAYQSWLAKFGNDPERPRAEYALAYASYQAQNETNALEQFSRFLTQFPTNPLAPRAQWWRADYFFRNGDYVNAEKDYQLLFRTWPTNALAYEARMMAGRAAIARQSWLDAIGYFTNLTSDLNCPVELKVQALFAYGDALRRSQVTDTNNPLVNFEEARRVFAKVHDLNSTNAAAARAWGEIGDCGLQLAVQDPRQYSAASNAFQQAVDAPAADVATRSQALIGLGLVAERLAERQAGSDAKRLLKQAQDYYLDVFYEKHLRAGERSDLFWLKRAGLEAERLAETLQEWPQAVRLSERLSELLPPLKSSLEKKIEKAREHLPK
jgi:tetratricopeptide (TPR) repeat protein